MYLYRISNSIKNLHTDLLCNSFVYAYLYVLIQRVAFSRRKLRESPIKQEYYNYTTHWSRYNKNDMSTSSDQQVQNLIA